MMFIDVFNSFLNVIEIIISIAIVYISRKIKRTKSCAINNSANRQLKEIVKISNLVLNNKNGI